MLATYIHDLDPVLLDLFGWLKLRWYGLAYLAGFVGGFYLLSWLASKKLWVLPKDKVADFITYSAFFGVFLGGRLGYLLFYYTRTHGAGWMIEDPLLALRVWEGGMASHGGIIGLILFTLFYSLKQKANWLGVGDGLCVVAPIGLFAGRVANFINGEIFGKVSQLPWAVKFPSAFLEDQPEVDRYPEAVRAAVEVDPSLIDPETGALPSFSKVIEHSRENPELLETLGTYLEPRHPAQLYEAFTEGLLLFSILLAVRLLCPKLPHGVLTGLFFIVYACARIFCETFKLSSTRDIFGLTMGTFLSLFMILAGIIFIAVGMKMNKRLTA